MTALIKCKRICEVFAKSEVASMHAPVSKVNMAQVSACRALLRHSQAITSQNGLQTGMARFHTVQGPGNKDCVQMDRLGDPGMRQPRFLRDLYAGARVRSDVLWHFDTLLEHSGDVAGIKGAALKLSGRHFGDSILSLCWKHC